MAFNYNVYFVDSASQGDGTGPYTVVLTQNPTTLASGGTTKYSNTNAVGTLNIIEMAKLAILAAVNANAANIQNDPLN